MEQKPFKTNTLHNANGSLSVDKVDGFQSFMVQMLEYIEKETGLDPERRFIDSAKLVDKIAITSEMLGIRIKYEIASGQQS